MDDAIAHFTFPGCVRLLHAGGFLPCPHPSSRCNLIGNHKTTLPPMADIDLTTICPRLADRVYLGGERGYTILLARRSEKGALEGDTNGVFSVPTRRGRRPGEDPKGTNRVAEFCKLRSGNAEVSLTQDPDERERSGDNARHDQREEFGFRGGRRGAPNPAAYPQLIAREGREIDPSGAH